MSIPSRKTLLLAIEQIVGEFHLTVEHRVPGNCVCVRWPDQVEGATVFEKEAVRAVLYIQAQEGEK